MSDEEDVVFVNLEEGEQPEIVDLLDDSFQFTEDELFNATQPFQKPTTKEGTPVVKVEPIHKGRSGGGASSSPSPGACSPVHVSAS